MKFKNQDDDGYRKLSHTDEYDDTLHVEVAGETKDFYINVNDKDCTVLRRQQAIQFAIAILKELAR